MVQKVTLIGSYMFANVPAENIVLPTSVKEIDYDAFANSELKSITIPENVQNISFEVFKGCKILRTYIMEAQSRAG